MRNYLIDFFQTFDYEADDAAFLLDAYDRIMQNDGTRELWAQALAIYDETVKCNYRTVFILHG